jgi:hypothetical protein
MGELVEVVFIREFVNETKLQFGVNKQNQARQAQMKAKLKAKATLVFNRSLRIADLSRALHV